MDTLLQTCLYIWQNLPQIAGLAEQHLYLVGIAVGLAVLLGVPLGC